MFTGANAAFDRRSGRVSQRRLGMLLLLASAGVLTCEKRSTEPSVPSFELTVRLGPGVTGLPSPGQSTYTAGSQVLYDLVPDQGYDQVLVALDGHLVPSSGTLTMDRNHEIAATADTVITIPPTDSSLLRGARALLTAADPVAAYQDYMNTVSRLYDSLGPAEARAHLDAVSMLAYDPVGDSSAFRHLYEVLGDHVFSARALGASLTGRPTPSSNETGSTSVTTTVLYVNGVLTWPGDALETVGEIDRVIAEAGLTGVEVKPFYNPTVTQAPGFSVASCAMGTVRRMLFRDPVTGTLRQVSGWLSWGALLARCSPLGDFVESGKQLFNVLRDFPAGASDHAKALAATIRAELQAGRKVILVLHSQGNLLGQEALKLIAATQPLDCIGVVSLAAPTSANWPVGTEEFSGFAVEGDAILSLGLNFFSQIETNITREAVSYVTEAKSFAGQILSTLVVSIYLHFVRQSYLEGIESRELIKRESRRQDSAIQCKPLPTIDSLIPASIAVLQRQLLTLYGRNLQGGSQVIVTPDSSWASVLVENPPIIDTAGTLATAYVMATTGTGNAKVELVGPGWAAISHVELISGNPIVKLAAPDTVVGIRYYTWYHLSTDSFYVAAIACQTPLTISVSGSGGVNLTDGYGFLTAQSNNLPSIFQPVFFDGVEVFGTRVISAGQLRNGNTPLEPTGTYYLPGGVDPMPTLETFFPVTLAAQVYYTNPTPNLGGYANTTVVCR